MGYLTPADVGVSDNRAAHVARGSREPGTDYATGYGTDLRAPESGVVILTDHSSSGAEGRRLSMLLDDGRVVDWIHLSSIQAWVGMRFGRGQSGLVRSGASGFGEDWYYGPHVHVTLRARQGLPFSDTLDFEDYISPPASSVVDAPAPPPPPPISQEDSEMLMLNLDNKVLLAVGEGILRHFIPGDPYTHVMYVSREPDGWQPISNEQLAPLLYTYGIDVDEANRVWKYDPAIPGLFQVWDPIRGSWSAGNMWSATNALRAEQRQSGSSKPGYGLTTGA